MLNDDIIINKTETIKRCISRILEEYDDKPENLQNHTKQDAILLNIQRLCEACIDMASHHISRYKLGVPQTSRDCFVLLQENQLIQEELSVRLQAMVGFRNIAVHDDQTINLEIVEKIIESYLYDGLELAEKLLEKDSSRP